MIWVDEESLLQLGGVNNGPDRIQPRCEFVDYVEQVTEVTILTVSWYTSFIKLRRVLLPPAAIYPLLGLGTKPSRTSLRLQTSKGAFDA